VSNGEQVHWAMASYAPPDAMVTNAFTPAQAVAPVAPTANVEMTEPPRNDLNTSGFKRDRKMLIEFNGTPAHFAGVPSAATWRIANKNTASYIFGVDGWGSQVEKGRAVDLDRVRFHSVEAYKTFSTMPWPVSIKLTGVKGNVYNKLGQRVALTVFPGTNNNKETILKKSEILDTTFTEVYPTYNAGNLRTEGIIKIPSGTAYMVSEGHPSIGILKTNPEILQGTDTIDTASMRDGCYFISTATMDHVLSIVENKIVSRLPDVNCTDYTATMSRADGLPFASAQELAMFTELSSTNKEKASQMVIAQPGMVCVELAMGIEPV